MDLGLTGRIALVTGSNRGTGEVIARRLAAEGAHVIVHSLTEGPSAEVAGTIADAVAVWGDITTDDGAERVASQALAHFPAIDILVNNYGVSARGTWMEAPSAQWIESYQHNALSAVRMARLLIPGMRARGGGRIVNLGTIGSTRPGSSSPFYYAAKGALANMTVSLAKELSGSNITVNLVSPGLIRTPEVEEALRRRAERDGGTTGGADAVQSTPADPFGGRYSNPMGRIAEREEVADLVLFLSSERAAFIHGQNIRIDGGALDIV